MQILVTGGAGYIGSHTVLELLNAGHKVTVIDNLSNSKYESLRRVQELTGKTVTFCNVDLLDQKGLESVFATAEFDAVIHFAAFKAVGESVEKPLLYYRNNVTGTLNLIDAMAKYGVKNIVFSSSCTVYGIPEVVPVREDSPRSAINPYGRTKLMMEEILTDVQAANPDWNVILLRYFNPIGAHISGRIGEDPNGIPNNLVPYIAQVAVGKREKLRVWGNDYPTPDGTGIRDYIHVVDLAIGHLKALDKLDSQPGLVAYNLGTGQGNSVLEVHAAFEKACGIKIPYEIMERRSGDAAAVFADPTFAEQELGWKAEFDINRMCEDSWRWQSQNPNGYDA